MSPSFSRFLFLVFLVFSSLASSSGDQDFLLLQRPLFADRHVAGSGDVDPENIWFLCASWRFAGEANNLAPWTVVPLECGGYVREYMTGKAYGFDLEITAREAAAFARSLTVADDGKDAWVFDVDETMLSNLPYYADRGFGLEVFNEQVFNKWVEKAVAPAINSSLKLYMEVLALGFKIFLLTGRSEAQRAITVDNLNSVGFRDWEKLILRDLTGSWQVMIEELPLPRVPHRELTLNLWENSPKMTSRHCLTKPSQELTMHREYEGFITSVSILAVTTGVDKISIARSLQGGPF